VAFWDPPSGSKNHVYNGRFWTGLALAVKKANFVKIKQKKRLKSAIIIIIIIIIS